VTFVVDNVAVGQVFSECMDFPLSVSLHHCLVLIFIYVLLLPEGQTGETREPSIKQCFFGDWMAEDGKYFHTFLALKDFCRRVSCSVIQA